MSAIQSLKHQLNKIFSIKDLGNLSYFLGMKVTYLNEGIVLSQQKFTKELLKESGLHKFKWVVTPQPINLKIQAGDSPLYHNPTHYIHKLNLLTHTIPDFSYNVQTLSQHMQNPTANHFKALTHTLNYVAHTSGQGVLLKESDALQLQAFCDHD